jgi:hypothetical protein
MRCPVCRAENDQGPQCRRCRADLSLLLQLDAQRRFALDEAGRSVARGQLRRALVLLEGVEALRRDVESVRLRALISLLQRDFAGAWRCYQEAVQP